MVRTQTITFRIDKEVLAYFKGDNPKFYHRRLNEALKAYIELTKSKKVTKRNK